MESWTKQKGHPVITIRRIGTNQIGIKQNRFILDTNVDKLQINEYKY